MRKRILGKSSSEILLSYMAAIRELVNKKARRIDTSAKSAETFLHSIKRQFGFNHESDWGLLCASMDLVEDTTLAIQNFEEFELEGPTRYDDVGEKYLRLYGILNAVYLQQSAVLNLHQIFRLDNPTQLRAQINALDITEIRHKVAAHAVNYADRTNEQNDCFIVARAGLRADNVHYMSYQTSEYREVKLLQLLQNNSKIMINVLDEVLDKAIRTVYKTAKVKQAELSHQLQLLRHERDGHIVIHTPEETTVIKMNPICKDTDEA